MVYFREQARKLVNSNALTTSASRFPSSRSDALQGYDCLKYTKSLHCTIRKDPCFDTHLGKRSEGTMYIFLRCAHVLILRSARLKISSYTCISQKPCMGVNLRGSHLFRASRNRHGQITQNAFQGSAVGNKLKRHLAALQLSDRKTMHGSRSGCSITLSLIGASDDDVAQHVGWKSLTTAQYYTQTRQVIHTSKTATLLSDDATLSTSILPYPASRVGSHFRNRNNLDNFSLTYISVYVPADV